MNPLKNVGLEVLLKLSIVNVTVSPFLTEIGYKLMIDLSLTQYKTKNYFDNAKTLNSYLCLLMELI